MNTADVIRLLGRGLAYMWLAIEEYEDESEDESEEE